MGTESGRGSLTGAAAAPACPSVKARASAASSLPPRLFPSPRSGPRLQPPGEPWRRRTQGHSVPYALTARASRPSYGASAESPSPGSARWLRSPGAIRAHAQNWVARMRTPRLPLAAVPGTRTSRRRSNP